MPFCVHRGPLLARSLAGVAVLLTGASVALAFALWLDSRPPRMELAPCRACASVYASSPIADLDLCTVMSAPEEFRDRTVRVDGVFLHDAGQTMLVSDACKKQSIFVGMSRDLVACAGTEKALEIHTGFRSWYDSEAAVTLVGRIGEIDNPDSYYLGEYGLNILCLERVNPLFKPSRIRYAIGRFFKFVMRREKV
jgi:hypothetical protein